MEFLDPVAKKKKKQRLYLGYVLLSILVGLATYILVATAIGYELFPRNGTIVQNGLLFVDSVPGDASISLNGKLESDRTEAKFALADGQYDITIQKEGYVDWSKSVSVEGGRVRFVTYPRLFPLVISPETIQSFSSSIGFVTQSPDRKWLLVQPNPNVPSITIFDLESESLSSTSFVLPPEVIVSRDGNFGRFVPIEWSNDNRHLLLAHDAVDGKRYFILVDRTSADQSINLNTAFSTEPSKVTLIDKKFDKYYFYYGSDGTLRTAGLADRVLNPPLLDQVLAYKSYGDNLISYATSRGAEAGQVAVNIWKDGNSYPLTTTSFDPESNYLLDIAKYRNVWYYPVASGTSNRVVVYRNPLDKIAKDVPEKPVIVTSLRMENPKSIEFSTNARFLVTQSGTAMHVYDAEDKQAYRFDIPRQFDSGIAATWADGHRLQYTSGGKLYIVEYDGMNERELLSVAPSTKGFFSDDYKVLYSFGLRTEGAEAFQQASLEIGN